MFDEIHKRITYVVIRKHIHLNGERYRDYIDYGTGLTDDACSCWSSCPNGRFSGFQLESPFSLLPPDGLTSKENATLIKICLQKLHVIGVEVVSLICDVPAGNLAMLKALGKRFVLNKLVTYFTHPWDPSCRVHVILDVCHMLKFIRSTLGDLKFRNDVDGNLIQWQYLVNLHILQESRGLHLANELRFAHINWHPQKMKVNLAAQSLSAGVADSLHYCSYIWSHQNLQKAKQHPNSCESSINCLTSSTQEFPWRRILKHQSECPTIPMLRNSSVETTNHIQHLEDPTGELILNARRKTGFLGFLVAIKSIQSL